MKLFFLYGLPGVGKLAVGRELSELTGYKLFHIHLLVDLLESVFGFGSQAFVDLRDKVWPLVLRRAAEEHLEGLITTFVFESSVKEGFMEDVFETVAGNEGEVLFVELKCARGELERRLVSPERKRYGKITSVEKLNKADGGRSLQCTHEYRNGATASG